MLFCFKDNECNLKSCESSLLCFLSFELKHFEIFSLIINWANAAFPSTMTLTLFVKGKTVVMNVLVVVTVLKRRIQ